LRTKTHSYGDVPFAMCGAGVRPLGQTSYDEPSATSGGLRLRHGHDLMGCFLANPSFTDATAE
jgi:2,3-bisphosphoglycerate-independent phosphoglycerate mutase